MRNLCVLLGLSLTLVTIITTAGRGFAQTATDPPAFELSTPVQRDVTPAEPTVKKPQAPFTTAPHSRQISGPQPFKPGKKPGRSRRVPPPQIAKPNLTSPEITLPSSPESASGRIARTQQLNLTLNGRGRVVSTPAGIDCGDGHTRCSAPFSENTAITLEAMPLPQQSFQGWILSGKEAQQCEDGNKYRTCNFTMGSSHQGIHADFTNKALLTVQFSPNSTGQGTLSDEAGQLRCTSPNRCSAAYDLNTLVPIHLTPDGDATFEQWAYVNGNRVEPLNSVGNLLNVRMNRDLTVQVLLHSQAYRTQEQLNRVGCVKRRGSDTEYTCNSMNGYAVCHSLFRDDRVSDCHVSFDASGFRELNLTREPNVELITREANITVHRAERGRSDEIRGVTYRMTFETPPPLPADRNSPCRGQAGCNSPCYVQLDLKEDAKTGELMSLSNKKTSCDNATEISITPSRYHGYKAFDMCREQATSRQLRSWNFDIDATVSERIGALYWFRRLVTQTRNSRQYDTVRLKRTTMVSAPMRIQCRE